MAYLLGLPSPLLWGALAFVLNYVPYVGPAIMDVLLFVIGLVTFPTLLGALMPPAVFMAITRGRGPVPDAGDRRPPRAQPASAGDLSRASRSGPGCGAPVGAFLATPILIIARVALDHLYPQHKAELPG